MKSSKSKVLPIIPLLRLIAHKQCKCRCHLRVKFSAVYMYNMYIQVSRFIFHVQTMWCDIWEQSFLHSSYKLHAFYLQRSLIFHIDKRIWTSESKVLLFGYTSTNYIIAYLSISNCIHKCYMMLTTKSKVLLIKYI